MKIQGVARTCVLALGLGCAASSDDTSIERQVEQRLSAEENLRGYPIRVVSVNREVTLFGHVSSASDRSRAEHLAERVRGVSWVRNRIEVLRRPASLPPVGSPPPTDSIQIRSAPVLGELGQPGRPIWDVTQP